MIRAGCGRIRLQPVSDLHPRLPPGALICTRQKRRRRVDETMRRKPCSILWVILLSPIVSHLQGQDEAPQPPKDPEILSISPLGGRQGSSFEIEVRGQTLGGVHAVWFDCRELRATIGAITEITLDEDSGDEGEEESDRTGQQVKLQVTVDSKAVPGAHLMRLLSPRGMSNAVTLHVSREKVMAEAETGLHPPQKAQLLSFPVVINGRLSRIGQADYFSFDAKKGQELLFEAHSGSGVLDPQLTLYEPSGSWFDPNQLTRLAFNDEAVSHSPMSSAGLTFGFSKKGRYLVRVSEFQGHGGPEEYSYQLRVVDARRSAGLPAEEVTLQVAAHPEPAVWQERDFHRELASERLMVLRSRTVSVPLDHEVAGKGDPPGSSGSAVPDSPQIEAPDLSVFTGVLPAVREQEDNETPEQALEITLPVIIEGVIGRPGDIDHYKFEVQSGQKLAFEIETPDSRPPDFNPRLGVLDATGKELFSNISTGRVRIQAKTIETFETGGKYILQIRDLTSRYGQSRFAYRVLLRPQIPHAGRIEVRAERLNLAAGEAGKLTIITDQEEGFGGEIAIAVENLPPGVEAYPGTEVVVEKPPPVNQYEDDKRFVPGSQTATVLLIAAADAPTTEMPLFAQVKARPIVQGRPGELLFAGKLPIMVVSPIKQESASPDSHKGIN